MRAARIIGAGIAVIGIVVAMASLTYLLWYMVVTAFEAGGAQGAIVLLFASMVITLIGAWVHDGAKLP